MPLKLNVGLSRKMGQANFGSRGAHVSLELELESSLVDRPQELHGRIRQLFALARGAVDEELRPEAALGSPAPSANGNGHIDAPPCATAAQLRALAAISRQERVVLADLARQQFGVGRPEELSKAQASALIDQLKGRAGTAASR